MSAINDFLFTAGMEGFNDPSSIPPVGIVVPFFGVEEFAEADAEQSVRMTEMNQQAEAIQRLQQTLVYINAHRPTFDRENAAVVQQALGEVQVLMPDMEDPVTIMGSLEHYTPAYTNHLLAHGIEGIGDKILSVVKKIIELLKKGYAFLSKAIQAKGVVFGKQKRELDELNAWFKDQRKSNDKPATTTGNEPKVVTVTAPTYLYTVDSNKPLAADRLASEVAKYNKFLQAFSVDFIRAHITLGDLYIRALGSLDIASTSNEELFTKMFKGQFKYQASGATLYTKRNGEMCDIETVGLIGGIGFKASIANILVAPLEMTADGSNQRKFFKQMNGLYNYSFVSKIKMDGSTVGNTPIYACSLADAERLVNQLDMLTNWMINSQHDEEIRDFNKRVTECVDKLADRAGRLGNDRSDFITTVINALSGISSGLENVSRGMNQQTNTLINNLREYVTKSTKA